MVDGSLVPVSMDGGVAGDDDDHTGGGALTFQCGMVILLLLLLLLVIDGNCDPENWVNCTQINTPGAEQMQRRDS